MVSIIGKTGSFVVPDSFLLVVLLLLMLIVYNNTSTLSSRGIQSVWQLPVDMHQVEARTKIILLLSEKESALHDDDSTQMRKCAS